MLFRQNPSSIGSIRASRSLSLLRVLGQGYVLGTGLRTYDLLLIDRRRIIANVLLAISQENQEHIG